MLDSVTGSVQDALAANLDDNATDVVTALTAASAAVRTERTWLAASGVDAPVIGDLDTRFASIESSLTTALAGALGVTISLPPVGTATGPVGTVTGSVNVANSGDTALSAVSATVSVDGWGRTTATAASVAPGATAQLPVSFAVPAHTKPGSYDATVSVQLTRGDSTFTLTDTTSGWASITSGLSIGSLTSAVGADLPAEGATVSVPVTNNGSEDVTGHVVASLPDGWSSVPSAEVTVAAGATKVVTVPVVAPLDVVGGSIPVTVSVVQTGSTLASKDSSFEFDLPTPPAATVIDHVDFGDGTSESAHAVQGSPSSGTNTEAGLTRRYSNSATPGSWYSAQVAVPDGKPFILRDIETFDNARTKKYNVYVNGTLVKTQLVTRTEPTVGTEVYDALIDDPAVLAGDGGSVRIKVEYPLDASGYFDPSIADMWVLPVPADTQAPAVSAYVADGTAGDAGWYRSDVAVKVDATDNRDGAPVVQTGTDAGWQTYVGPVAVTGDGKHTLSYRATDAAGQRTTAALPVWIDSTSPVTTLKVASGASTPDRATLQLAATDALSGVGRTVYRIDGGDWQVLGATAPTLTGFGEHTVDFGSTDVAGNVEAVHTATVTLADVDALAPIIAPQVTGAAKIGSLLTSTTGSWNTQGITFTRQWLRNGRAISGATAASYRVTSADVGARLSVQVTASKTGEETVKVTSAATAPVARAASSTRVSVNRSTLRSGKKLSATVVVTASGVAPSGTVKVLVDGRVKATASLRSGRATVSVKLTGRGKHKVTASYAGSPAVAPSSSSAVVVKLTK